MVLKDYQIKVVKALKRFYTEAEKKRRALKGVDENLYVEATCSALNLNFGDRPKNGLGKSYPRFCIKVPTAGGKTLLAIEAIREYQNIFAKRRTGLVVWITHRETIYRQTIEKLRDKNTDDIERLILERQDCIEKISTINLSIKKIIRILSSNLCTTSDKFKPLIDGYLKDMRSIMEAIAPIDGEVMAMVKADSESMQAELLSMRSIRRAAHGYKKVVPYSPRFLDMKR